MSNPERQPTSESHADTTWTLWREDIYGNQYRMPLDLADEDQATTAQEVYTAKGHHQTYFTRQMLASDTDDFIACDQVQNFRS